MDESQVPADPRTDATPVTPPDELPGRDPDPELFGALAVPEATVSVGTVTTEVDRQIVVSDDRKRLGQLVAELQETGRLQHRGFLVEKRQILNSGPRFGPRHHLYQFVTSRGVETFPSAHDAVKRLLQAIQVGFEPPLTIDDPDDLSCTVRKLTAAWELVLQYGDDFGDAHWEVLHHLVGLFDSLQDWSHELLSKTDKESKPSARQGAIEVSIQHAVLGPLRQQLEERRRAHLPWYCWRRWVPQWWSRRRYRILSCWTTRSVLYRLTGRDPGSLPRGAYQGRVELQTSLAEFALRRDPWGLHYASPTERIVKLRS